MRKIILLLGIIMFLGFNNSHSYEYKEEVGGHKGKVFLIERDGLYKVIAAFSDSGDSLRNIVNDAGGVAGINGAFFCPKDYSSCFGKNSSDGDRISNGIISSRWYNTGERYIFGFDEHDKPLIYKTPNNQKDSFDGIHNGLSNFPLILKEGKSYLDYYKNLIDAKMKLKGPKNFICSTKEEDIYMGYLSNKTIYEMVGALQDIGCYNALNLDSGWSLSLYDKGEYKTGPGRDVMDSFVIIEDKKKVEKLNEKVSIITVKLFKYINKQNNKNVMRNKIVNKLNTFLSKKLTERQKYLIEKIIFNLKKV